MTIYERDLAGVERAPLDHCGSYDRWERGRKSRPSHDSRRFLNGMLHVLRVDCPWRDIHERYGKLDARRARPADDRQHMIDSVEKVRVAAVLKHFSIRHVEVKRFRACGFSGV
ncbi:transposase [Mesorhizobium sp. M0895]|uniref:transposase n=1 Tax=Mesorhizobium sp. M0895 TaxID=2957019 RepID=UPI00333B3A2E